MLFCSASSAKRGLVRRQSVGSRSDTFWIAPVKNPRPKGLYGTKPIPSSRQVARTPFASTSRDQSEYSLCKAAIGGPLAELRRLAGFAYDTPSALTVPTAP